MSTRNNNTKAPKKLAKWLRFYDIVAYVVFSVDLLYALGYITYIGILINDWKMYLPYKPSRAWLELNSYSLLPSFSAPLLIWQVGARVELSSGDFYDRSYCSSDEEARAFRIAMQSNVRGITYVNWQYSLVYGNLSNNFIVLDYEHGKDGYRVQKSSGDDKFLAMPNNISLPPGGFWKPPYTADRGVRWWTHLIQKDFKCCGSNIYTEWDIFDGDIYTDWNTNRLKAKYGNYPPSCYCDFECERNEIFRENCFSKCGHSAHDPHAKILATRKGCCIPYLQYLHNIYLVTFAMTLILCLLYGVTICVYILNYAATRTGSDVLTEHDPTVALIESDKEEDYFHGKFATNKPKTVSSTRIRSPGQYHTKSDNKGKLLSTTSASNNPGRGNDESGGLRQTVSDQAVLNKRKLKNSS
ncbi:unnamed protein product [Allacma fusca]|uniref:Uncharacterized protein n=1 Tax=Allacma fusca TaxID=39272 RepID=A0A8J2PP27_9HEXA|nr:unnamed protein product [Allacma fusca]